MHRQKIFDLFEDWEENKLVRLSTWMSDLSIFGSNSI